MTRDEKDKVTVGVMRKYFEETLDSHIDTLSKLIRQREHHQATSFLRDTIVPRIEELNLLDSWAGLPALIKKLREH